MCVNLYNTNEYIRIPTNLRSTDTTKKLKETDSYPDIWLMRHKSIPGFPHRKASASLNRRSFGSKRYF